MVYSWYTHRQERPQGRFKILIMKSLISYLKNVRGEFQHIVWPKPRIALIHTGLIIALSAFIAVFIGVLDYGFTSVVSFIINR